MQPDQRRSYLDHARHARELRSRAFRRAVRRLVAALKS
jgi:hypothetical protein